MICMFLYFNAYFEKIFLFYSVIFVFKICFIVIRQNQRGKEKHVAALFVAITLFYYLYCKLSIVLLLIKE